MEPTTLKPGDIVQLNPEGPFRWGFGGCLMVVTEPKAFGAQGYCTSPEHPGGQFFIRVNWKDMELTGGHAEWVIGSEQEGIEAAAQGLEVSVIKDLPGQPSKKPEDAR